MLGESGRGTHIHSTEPAEEIRQVFSQSERNAKSAIGGNGLRWAPDGTKLTGGFDPRGDCPSVPRMSSDEACKAMPTSSAQGTPCVYRNGPEAPRAVPAE